MLRMKSHFSLISSQLLSPPQSLCWIAAVLLGNSLRDRPKLPVYFRPRNIRWSETDDTVSVNRAERLSIPFDADQTVLQ